VEAQEGKFKLGQSLVTIAKAVLPLGGDFSSCFWSFEWLSFRFHFRGGLLDVGRTNPIALGYPSFIERYLQTLPPLIVLLT
jgi:hypothetical protein